MMKLVLRKSLPNSTVENALYLEKIYFVKEWIGKGVGKKLIEFALQRAVEFEPRLRLADGDGYFRQTD